VDILLTGSTGFLGGRLSKYLSEKHGVCNFTGDILNGVIPFNNQVFGKDAVVHLVGLNDSCCRQDPLKAHLVNIIGTHNIVKRATEFKKVVYFSTIHVYGYPPEGVITESKKPNPQSVYALSHYLSEEMVRRHYKGTVLRFSNGFGCPANDSPTAWVVVVNAMCKQAVENKSIILHTDPNESRDFITVSDMCKATEHVLKNNLYGVYNVGTGKTTKMSDMADLVAERCKEIIGHRPSITFDSRHFQSTKNTLEFRIDKLLNTGWLPEFNYQKEIDDTLKMIGG
jgi:UDP-glucose 4-epimerase